MSFWDFWKGNDDDDLTCVERREKFNRSLEGQRYNAKMKREREQLDRDAKEFFKHVEKRIQASAAKHNIEVANALSRPKEPMWHMVNRKQTEQAYNFNTNRNVEHLVPLRKLQPTFEIWANRTSTIQFNFKKKLKNLERKTKGESYSDYQFYKKQEIYRKAKELAINTIMEMLLFLKKCEHSILKTNCNEIINFYSDFQRELQTKWRWIECLNFNDYGQSPNYFNQRVDEFEDMDHSLHRLKTIVCTAKDTLKALIDGNNKPLGDIDVGYLLTK